MENRLACAYFLCSRQDTQLLYLLPGILHETYISVLASALPPLGNALKLPPLPSRARLSSIISSPPRTRGVLRSRPPFCSAHTSLVSPHCRLASRLWAMLRQQEAPSGKKKGHHEHLCPASSPLPCSCPRPKRALRQSRTGQHVFSDPTAASPLSPTQRAWSVLPIYLPTYATQVVITLLTLFSPRGSPSSTRSLHVSSRRQVKPMMPPVETGANLDEHIRNQWPESQWSIFRRGNRLPRLGPVGVSAKPAHLRVPALRRYHLSRHSTAALALTPPPVSETERGPGRPSSALETVSARAGSELTPSSALPFPFPQDACHHAQFRQRPRKRRLAAADRLAPRAAYRLGPTRLLSQTRDFSAAVVAAQSKRVKYLD